MGRWGVGFFVGICVVGSAACSSGSGPVRIGPRVGGVRFPAPVSVDPGVIRVGSAVGHEIEGEPRVEPGGLRVTLDRCELNAPGVWVVDGHVAVPHGAHNVSATLNVGFLLGDEGNTTWTHRVTFSGSGAFAFVMPVNKNRSGDALSPTDDTASTCFTTVAAASVPIGDSEQFAGTHTTATHAPFVYVAPAGSIQAFGIGAPLDKPLDPRTISLYTVWSGARSSVTNVYVPVVAGQRPALLPMRSTSDPCGKVSVAIGSDDDPTHEITVTTGFDCGAPRDDPETMIETHEPVADAHGFTWARPASADDQDVARRSNGTEEIWVQGGSAVARTTVAHIAATLTSAVNVATQPAVRRPALLNTAVTTYLHDHPGWTERARFHYRGGWAIFVESAGGSSWDYRILTAGEIYSGWWLEDPGGGGGGQQRCFSGPTYSAANEGQDTFAFSITGDPHWGIESLVNGKWQTVPSTNGVEFEDATVSHPAAFPLRERPVDAGGHVPGCFVG